MAKTAEQTASGTETPMTAMGAAWVENIAALQHEMIGFLTDRIKEDVKTQQELLRCKGLADVQKVQLAFVEKTYKHYLAEGEKLQKLGMSLLPSAVSDAKSTPL